MLRLYINQKFFDAEKKYSPLLFPFFGSYIRSAVTYAGAFTKIIFDKQYYTLVDSPEQCDCVMLPYNIWSLKRKEPQLLHEMLSDAHNTGKPVLIDAFGDTMDILDIPNSIVLRFAQYKRRLKQNDIIIPAYIEDLLQEYRSGSHSLRSKGDRAMVGFVGWGNMSFKEYPRTYLKEMPIWLWSKIRPTDGVFRKGVFWRAEALCRLQNSQDIETEFIIRGSYSGNTKTAQGDPAVLREQFISNIENTDYTLCQKGDSNQSTRFYEVLSMGRIPLVIDTECVFPLEDKINYKDFSIFIDHTDIKKAGEIVAQKHAAISGEEFLSMQQKAREVFENYLRIDVFTKYLVEEIQKRVKK